MKKLILFLFLDTGLLFGCDGPYKNCPDHYFTNEFKSYTTFSDGTYWIFKDSINNALDSVYLLSQELKYKDNCDYHGDPQELLYQTFYSSFFYPNEFNIICGAEMPIYQGDNFLGFFRDDLEIGESMGFTFETKYDSLLINNYWYKDIMVFSKDNNFKYYWAKGIGLIKKMFPDPHNGDIIYDFEIERYRLN